MAGVKIVGTEQFEVFARKAKAAGSEGKGLINELRRAMKDGAKPVTEDARSNVMALSSKARGSGARAARTAFRISKRKRGLSEHAKAKIHAHTGLRSSAARATQLQVTLGGKTVRARIRVNSSMMPADQRKLPAHMNSGRWRHPVLGNKRAWVTQTVSPDHWFDRAVDKGGPKVREQAFVTVERFLQRF